MDTAIVEKVIITDILRRGKGTKESPTRVITQVWTLNGTLIAEHDPYLEAMKVKE